MLNTPRLLVIAVFLGAASACAAPVLDAAQIADRTLDNGFHVVVKSAPHWDLVAVGFCIKASPMYETEEQQGLSDLVRHFIFDIAPPGGQPLGAMIDDLGASVGSYTTQDATQVSVVCSAQFLPEILPRLAKAVFEPEFTEEAWAKTLPGLRRRVEATTAGPERKLNESMWSTAFRRHPYGRPVLVMPDNVSKYNSKALADFHQALYVPNNISLVVVGDVKAEDVFRLAEANMGKYERRELTLPTVPREPRQTETRTRLAKANIRNTLLAFGWQAAGMDRKTDVCALDLIYALLNEGQKARLIKAFAEKEQFEALPEVEFITKRDPGLFKITCVAKPSAEFDTRETVLKELQKLQDEKISEDELAAAKAVIHAGYAFDNETYESQVGSMAFYEAIDSYRFAVDYLSELDTVTVEDVQRVAKRYLGLDAYTLVIIRPKKTGGPVWEAHLTQ